MKKIWFSRLNSIWVGEELNLVFKKKKIKKKIEKL